MTVWVKVCGLTLPEDVEAAVAAGADAIGLSLVGRSPRAIDPQRASELAAIARGRVAIVALVEGEVEEALATAHRIGATTVQPYGTSADAIAAAAGDSGLAALLPVAVAPDRAIDTSALPAGVRPLLDTAVGGSSGGSGRSFDWPRARQVPEAVIAGGLGPDNVGLAIAAARPWGVDASSRLELEPGRKDHSKVAAFIEAAKSA